MVNALFPFVCSKPRKRRDAASVCILMIWDIYIWHTFLYFVMSVSHGSYLQPKLHLPHNAWYRREVENKIKGSSSLEQTSIFGLFVFFRYNGFFYCACNYVGVLQRARSEITVICQHESYSYHLSVCLTPSSQQVKPHFCLLIWIRCLIFSLISLLSLLQ